MFVLLTKSLKRITTTLTTLRKVERGICNVAPDVVEYEGAIVNSVFKEVFTAAHSVAIAGIKKVILKDIHTVQRRHKQDSCYARINHSHASPSEHSSQNDDGDVTSSGWADG